MFDVKIMREILCVTFKIPHSVLTKMERFSKYHFFRILPLRKFCYTKNIFVFLNLITIIIATRKLFTLF